MTRLSAFLLLFLFALPAGAQTAIIVAERTPSID